MDYKAMKIWQSCLSRAWRSLGCLVRSAHCAQTGQATQLLAEHGTELILQLAGSGAIRYASPAVRRLLGRDPAWLGGRILTEIIHAADRNTVQLGLREAHGAPQILRFRLLHVHAGWLWVESTVRLADGNGTDLIAVCRDIGAQRRAEDNARRVARQDSLTGLPNRLVLTERIDASILRARRDDGMFALAMFDLDRFKYVNNTLGHAAGDQLLREAAKRLRQSANRADLLARWSGDAFVLLIARITTADDARSVVHACLASLAAPFVIDGRLLHLGASAGIVVSPEHGRSESELLRNADMALHRAKTLGAGSVVNFSPDLAERAHQRLTLENDLHSALRHQEFELRYQPIVSARTGHIEGAEALIRWRRDDKMISPDQFIPVAEESGLIVPIGAWVMQHACKQASMLIAEGVAGPEFYVSVNVSARQFHGEDFAAFVRTTLAATGLAAQQLQIELTESAIMADPATTACAMRGLRESGVQIAIDDFGTGYSSLGYLARFPASGLKIDKSFVAGMSQGPGASIVHATIAMAAALHMKVTAEGVETAAQRDLLRASGCERLQGYLFAAPLTLAELREHLSENTRIEAAMKLAAIDRAPPQRLRTQSM